ncbi:MAG: hypothetical protein ACHP8B_17575 [Terriglobales bacterium]
MTNAVWKIRFSSGQIEADLPAMGGPAAGAQSQSTPGASALAAPHQQRVWARERRARWLAKWLGVLEAAVVLGGLAGLVTGMYLLATSPLPGVMVMLASMALLLSSVAKLAEAQEVRQECDAGRERFSRSRAGSSGR